MQANEHPPIFLQPRFGLITTISVACVLIVCVLDPFGISLRADEAAAGGPPGNTEMLWRGIVYGLVGVLSWMIASVLTGVWRLIGLLSLAFVSAWVLASASLDGAVIQNLFRYMATTWGLILTSTLCLFAARLPKWERLAPEKRSISQTSEMQFSLTDLVSAMTAAAVLFAVTQRYQPPIQASQYWLVLIAIWAGIAIQQVCISIVVLSTNMAYQVIAAMVPGIVVLVVVGGVAYAELTFGQRATEPNPPTLREFMELYGAIFMAAAVTVWLLTLTGRLGRFVAKKQDDKLCEIE